MQAIAGPIIPTPDDCWVWSNRWNENWQGKPKSLEKAYPSTTSSGTNPTSPELGLTPDRRDGKPTTNRLSYSPRSARLHSCMCLVSGIQYFVQTSFMIHVAILKSAQTRLLYSYLCTKQSRSLKVTVQGLILWPTPYTYISVYGGENYGVM
jgi:hypothetical protein